jgi:hypothetical protein
MRSHGQRSVAAALLLASGSFLCLTACSAAGASKTEPGVGPASSSGSDPAVSSGSSSGSSMGSADPGSEAGAPTQNFTLKGRTVR